MAGHEVSIIPAAPLLLPAASPAQPSENVAEVAALRDRVRRVLERLPEAETVLLLDGGPESVVHDADRASLAGYGYPQVGVDVRIDRELLAAVSSRGQAPRVRSDRLDGDPAVLALLLAEVRPELALAPVTVPRGASARSLHDIAIGLAGALATVERTVAVIAAGDLAATLTERSPGYLVDGATSWDGAAVAAVRAGDPDAFAQLGPEDAARVRARGWAPIVVALQLAAPDHLAFAEVHYLAPRGVGQLVAG